MNSLRKHPQSTDRENLTVFIPAPLPPGSPLSSSFAASPLFHVCSFSCFCTDSMCFPSAQAEIHSFTIERSGPSFLDFLILIPQRN